MGPVPVWSIMLAIFLLVVGVDVYLEVDGKDDNTFSERIRFWGRVWRPSRLLVCMFLGVLAGHWYW